MSAAPSRARHPSRCACSRVSIAPRVTVATRLPMRAEGCSNSSWHSLCFRRAVTSIAKMGEILYPFVKHRKTVSVAPEECAPPIFDFPSDSDSDRRLRRPAAGALEPASRGPRITFSRTNFTLPPTRYAGHRNLVSPLFARMRSPRVRGIYSARALRALSVERAPVVFFPKHAPPPIDLARFFAPQETRARSVRRARSRGPRTRPAWDQLSPLRYA